jgi:hypothetical protein
MNLYYPGMEFETVEEDTPTPTDAEAEKAILDLFDFLSEQGVFEDALMDLGRHLARQWRLNVIH